MPVVSASPRTIRISGQRFAVLWRATSMSQETFAARVGMKRSGVFRLLRPGVHGMFTDNFRRLAEVLQMTPEQLRDRIGADEERPPWPSEVDSLPRLEAGVRGPVQPLREVTQFHGISAGGRDERLDVRHGTIKVPQNLGDFFVRLVGDSMKPEYPNNAVALFETVEGQQFTFGKDYLVWFDNGECYFSRVYESDEDRDVLLLRKLNPDKDRFPDRKVHRREVQRIARCIGVMINKS
jgi:phage repressor protein C with HTH and peptisase S24 domain